jgi:hypothetical protein
MRANPSIRLVYDKAGDGRSGLQSLQITLHCGEKFGPINKTRGGSDRNFTAGHCHPATPASVFLLTHDIRT